VTEIGCYHGNWSRNTGRIHESRRLKHYGWAAKAKGMTVAQQAFVLDRYRGREICTRYTRNNSVPRLEDLALRAPAWRSRLIWPFLHERPLLRPRRDATANPTQIMYVHARRLRLRADVVAYPATKRRFPL